MKRIPPLQIITCFILAIVVLTAEAEPKRIRVGIYDNRPLVFMGPDGPEGLFIDVLQTVAQGQEWELEYHYASWDASFRALQAGQLDLLPVVAYSDERARMIEFSESTLIANWGEIFTRRGLDIVSITDLQNLTIAYMENDTHSMFFRKLLETLGVGHTSLIVDSYTDMLAALEDGRAAAGVFNHLQASMATAGHEVRITPIVLNPIQIRYASPKGDPEGLLVHIDAHIQLIRSGDESEYRRLIHHWFGVDSGTALPRWAWGMALAGLAVILLVLGLNLWLRRMVFKRTSDLQTSNNALKASESRYRTILSSTMDGYMLVDHGGIILEANDAYHRMSGYNAGELFRMHVSQIDVKDNREAVAARLARVMVKGHDRFESVHRRKDGSLYDIEVSLQYHPDNPEHLITFIRDISERKRFESVRAFLARTSGGSAGTGFFNELARYLGESLSMNFVFINTIDKDALNAIALAVWHEGVFEDNISYPLKDTPCGETLGKDICTFSSGVKELFPDDPALKELGAEGYVGMTLRDHSGKPIGLIVLISKKPIPDPGYIESTLALAGIRAAAELERMQAERTLREQAEYQRAIFDYSPLPMFSMDLEGRVLFCNAAAEQIFGWGNDEIAGIMLPIVPEDRKEEFNQLKDLLISGQTISGLELVRQKKAGGTIDVSLWSAPIYNDKHEIIGIISFYEDIGERKAIAERLKRNLEEKQILLREIHHRVKNNLSVISSLLNLQSATITNPEQAIEAFRNSRDRIMAMALVHMELYESGDFAQIDMETYLGNLTRQIALVNENAGQVSLVSHTDSLMLDLQVAVPCGLILNELITNAYKYACRDDQKVSIEVSMSRSAAGHFAISVSDNGPGLPEGYENSGSLGLTLVSLLVGQIDGTMDVDSSENGTRIRIDFPDPRR